MRNHDIGKVEDKIEFLPFLWQGLQNVPVLQNQIQQLVTKLPVSGPSGSTISVSVEMPTSNSVPNTNAESVVPIMADNSGDASLDDNDDNDNDNENDSDHGGTLTLDANAGNVYFDFSFN